MRYNAITPETYRGFGFPGADDLGNMFQVDRDFEKKMFGGLAFLLHGNMCCCVMGQDLMVRVGPAAYEDALAKPHARIMDFTKKPLKGYLYVGPKGVATAAALREWLARATDFVGALPPK